MAKENKNTKHFYFEKFRKYSKKDKFFAATLMHSRNLVFPSLCFSG